MKLFWILLCMVCLLFALGLLVHGDKANAAFFIGMSALYYAFYVENKKADK